ncbi:hypothetical protein IX95_21455 [Vibrio sp. B183]|nr:hypothetical protein IX95_21455 [Vibrio sp. B183]
MQHNAPIRSLALIEMKLLTNEDRQVNTKILDQSQHGSNLHRQYDRVYPLYPNSYPDNSCFELCDIAKVFDEIYDCCTGILDLNETSRS